MKILIVEDERLLAGSIEELLRNQGFEAEAVHDGETGLSYARTGVYDLVILDVMMPGKNGYEVAKALRSSHLGTPILMLTARSGLEDRITGLDAGADYYLTKPFDSRELTACVRALLRRQGSQVDEMGFGNTILDLSTAVLSCAGKEYGFLQRNLISCAFCFSPGQETCQRRLFLPEYGGMILMRWKTMWRFIWAF